jgi:hypothetical protein
MLAALAVSADVAWAQFVPPSRSGMYYGWGPYVSDAVVPRSTRAAQEGADRRQQLQQNFAQHQAMNQQLLSTAQQRTAQIKQQRQTTDQLRMNLAQQHADRLASASQGAYMPPAGVPGLPAGPTVPGPKSEAGDDGSEPPATSAIPTSGEMRWPTVLREPQFDKPRSELEKLLRAAHQSQAGLTSAEYEDIVKAAEKMREILRSMVHDLSAAEYLWVDQYLQNLAKQATQLAHP